MQLLVLNLASFFLQGRVEEAVDSEFEAQLPNKPETGASMPKDIEEVKLECYECLISCAYVHQLLVVLYN